VGRVDDAASGEEGLRKLASGDYDIILCDYNLGPGRDGQQVFEEAKFRNHIRNSAVFMMITAESSMGMVMGVLEYRPDGYLVKPFTRAVLENRLEKLWERKNVFLEAETAVAEKDYWRALSICDEKIANGSKKFIYDFLRLKAELLVRVGRLDEAEAAFGQVLEARRLSWALFGLGQVRFFQERYDEARDLFRQVVEENRVYMDAYDWLARALEKLGDLEEGQRVLSEAVSLSPKVIGRHKHLGEIALKNNDLSAADTAFSNAVKYGRGSCFKDPSDYARLAEIRVQTASADEAIRVLWSARKEFRGDPAALVETRVMEERIYREDGRTADAKKTAGEVLRLAREAGGKIRPAVALEVAQVAFGEGDVDYAKELLGDVIRNNHEDENLIQAVRNVFAGVDLGEEGSRMIDKVRQEVVGINNEGVALVEAGRLEEAIRYFEKAAEGLPQNRTVLLNASQAIIMYLEKTEPTAALVGRAKDYLDRAGRISGDDRKYQILRQRYERLRAGWHPGKEQRVG